MDVRADWLCAGRFSPCVELYRNERLGLAGATCGEVARLTVSELEVEFRPAELRRSLRGFVSGLRSYTEEACLWGQVAFKPCFGVSCINPGGGACIGVECVTPDRYVIDGFLPDGTPTGAEFRSEIRRGDRIYVRTEKHIIRPGRYSVTNSVQVKELRSGRMYQGRLSDVPEWEYLSPCAEFRNVKGPLFALFSMPRAADGDGRGQPIFRRGEKLIRECEKQLDRLLWEYEGGELAIDASYDAFRTGRDGRPELPRGSERLWRTNMLDSCSSQSELLKTFAPKLRDESYIRGLNRLLMHYEDAVGLSRGTFSDPEEKARTATEVAATRQRTLTLAADVRRELIYALQDLSEAVSQVCGLYRLGYECSLTVKAGDGIIESGQSETASFPGESENAPAEAVLGTVTKAGSGSGRL